MYMYIVSFGMHMAKKMRMEVYALREICKFVYWYRASSTRHLKCSKYCIFKKTSLRDEIEPVVNLATQSERITNVLPRENFGPLRCYYAFERPNAFVFDEDISYNLNEVSTLASSTPRGSPSAAAAE